MSDQKPPKPPADELAKQLQQSLAKRRPRPWLAVLAALVVCSLVLAGLALWLYPRSRTPPLQVLALDGVFPSDETPTARAQLFVLPADEPAPVLNGFDILFKEQQPITRPDVKPRVQKVKSDARGFASVDWQIGDAKVAEFFVKYIPAERQRGGGDERGRLFVWPRDASLFLVDADTLRTDKLDPDAESALGKAAEDGWRIVYLAPEDATPLDFRKTAGWIERHASLPKGPLLGRWQVASEEPPRETLIKHLQARFTGPLHAVVKTREAAETSRALSVMTTLLAEGDAKWVEVVRQLKK